MSPFPKSYVAFVVGRTDLLLSSIAYHTQLSDMHRRHLDALRLPVKLDAVGRLTCLEA